MHTPTETGVELTMQVAQIVPCTEAEGPGKRFALWFQGCPLRCPGCCNPEYLPFKGGTTRALSELVEEIRLARDESSVEGITLMGGEPTAHAVASVALAKAARALGLSVMTFTGFTLEELQEKAAPAVLELIALTDILVDGPYVREQPDTTRRWIGSTNQRIHFLTPRYSLDEQWRKKNTLEIRVVGREITVNGFPAANAVGLWKGWKRKKPLPLTPGAAVKPGSAGDRSRDIEEAAVKPGSAGDRSRDAEINENKSTAQGTDTK